MLTLITLRQFTKSLGYPGTPSIVNLFGSLHFGMTLSPSTNENHLKSLIEPIRGFLRNHLQLELHPKKLLIKKLTQGIDFVGYVLFSKHTLVCTRTKQRIEKRLKETYEKYLEGKITGLVLDQKLQSYLGILSHANQHQLSQGLKNAFWVRSQVKPASSKK